MVKPLDIEPHYSGHLSIADTFLENQWCPLLRGFTVHSHLIRSQKKIIVSSPSKMYVANCVWSSSFALLWYFYDSKWYIYNSKKAIESIYSSMSPKTRMCGVREGVRPYSQKRETRIFSCDIDKILLDQNYATSVLLTSHVIT